jgi:FkbM family methyltransferase
LRNFDGGVLATLRILFEKGIRYSTVIDVGCADGHFFLLLYEMGIVPGSVPFNIDANRLYEDSLQIIQTVVGGDYSINAITDHDGEIELTMGSHPYWSSLRPKDDPYWAKINNLSGTKMVVPATTLDKLCKRFALTPPFLLKLDLQGAEGAALAGGAGMLKDTHVVVCETDIDDFRAIDRILAQHNFVLYDVTELHRLSDETLGWFYPIYVNRALNNLRSTQFWAPTSNDAVVQIQAQRRQSVLKMNAEILARIQRNSSAPQNKTMSKQSPSLVSRNDPCPCGSEKNINIAAVRISD